MKKQLTLEQLRQLLLEILVGTYDYPDDKTEFYVEIPDDEETITITLR